MHCTRCTRFPTTAYFNSAFPVITSLDASVMHTSFVWLFVNADENTAPLTQSIECLFPHIRWKPRQSLCAPYLLPYLSSLSRRRLASHFATDSAAVGILENILQRQCVILARIACRLIIGTLSTIYPVDFWEEAVLWSC